MSNAWDDALGLAPTCVHSHADLYSKLAFVAVEFRRRDLAVGRPEQTADEYRRLARRLVSIAIGYAAALDVSLALAVYRCLSTCAGALAPLERE